MATVIIDGKKREMDKDELGNLLSMAEGTGFIYQGVNSEGHHIFTYDENERHRKYNEHLAKVERMKKAIAEWEQSQ